MFPISFSNTPVSYGGSDILKATASFNFDRYVAGRVSSLDIARGTDNNRVGGVLGDAIDAITSTVRNNSRNSKVVDSAKRETRDTASKVKGSKKAAGGSGQVISEYEK